MPASARTVSLTEHQQQFLDAQVAAGRHGSTSEVVREALRRRSRNRVAGERVRDPRRLLVAKIVGARLVVLAVVHDVMVNGIRSRIEEGERG